MTEKKQSTALLIESKEKEIKKIEQSNRQITEKIIVVNQPLVVQGLEKKVDENEKRISNIK